MKCHQSGTFLKIPLGNTGKKYTEALASSEGAMYAFPQMLMNTPPLQLTHL